MSIILFGGFYLNGVTFINKGDGFNEYIRGLLFNAKELRKFLTGIISDHSISIPEWSFAIGEGADTFNSVQYNFVLNRYTLLSLFFKPENMYICYDLIQFIRLFLCGIAFIILCREFIPDIPVTGILAGSLVYTFCSYCLSEITYNTSFLCFLIFLPLLITGVERVIKGKTGIVYVLSFLLCAFNGYYRLYVCGLFTASYCLTRLIFTFRTNIRGYVLPVIRLLIFTAIGALTSMFCIFPKIYGAVNNPRIGVKFDYYPVEDISFFLGLPSFLITLIPAASLVTVLLIFSKKKCHSMLKFFIISSIIMLFFRFFSSMFNGFTYPLGRWHFVFALIYAFSLPLMWKELTEGISGSTKKIAACLAVLLLLCVLLEESRDTYTFIVLGLAALMLALLSLTNLDSRKRGLVILAVCIAGIIANNTFIRQDRSGSYDYMVSKDEFYESLYDNESKAIEAMKTMMPSDPADPLGRYSGSKLSNNSGLLRNQSSTSYYWSTINPYGYSFRKNIGLIESLMYIYSNYDERTVANAISSIKYYLSDEERIPFGYSFAGSLNVNENRENRKLAELAQELGTTVDQLTEEQAGTVISETENYEYVFVNDYALPMGFTYDSYIPYETYSLFSAPNKEWSMLDAVVLRDYKDEAKVYQGIDRFINDETRLKSEISEIDPELTQRDDRFISSRGGGFTVNFESVPNSELYCYIEGLEYEEIDPYDLYFGDDESYDPQHYFNRVNFKLLSGDDQKEIIKDHFTKEPSADADIYITTPDERKSRIHYTPSHRKQYNNRHDYVINLGYREEQPDSVYINFTQTGIFTMKDISIYALPMEDYPEKIARLKENILEDVNIDGDVVTGHISLDRDKFLYMSIPFSQGWSATDNGEAVKLYCANDMYMAIPLSAGDHDIRLEYRTPYLRTGALLSLLGILIFIGYIILVKIQKDKTAVADKAVR